MNDPSKGGTSLSDIVSVGVELNKNVHLMKINQIDPLVKVVEGICGDFNLPEPKRYGLQFDNHPSLGYSFITENNRHEIKDGSVCRLVFSASYYVKIILTKLVSANQEETLWGLQKVLSFIRDPGFVSCFTSSEGVVIVVTLLQGNALSTESLSYALKCVAELLQLGLVPLEAIKDRILDKVMTFVIQSGGAEIMNSPARVQESSLSIARTLLEKHSAVFPEVYETLTAIDRVIPHLCNINFSVQQSAIAVINAIFAASNTVQRKILLKKYAQQIREIVYKYVIIGHKVIPEETKQHLALFQSQFMGRLRRKAASPVDMLDSVVKTRIQQLARLSFAESDEEAVAVRDTRRRNTFVENTLYLLTDYAIPPPIEVTETTPPSILVLDCMTHFTRTYHRNYIRAVLEHSVKTAGQKGPRNKEYPFVELCTKLIAVLTDALGITNSTVQDMPYHPVLFSCERSFEEIFCSSIMVFSKTCKEMRARSEDFQKVINVVRKKVEVALSNKPISLKDYESNFYTLVYGDIARVWEEERQDRERKEFREKKSLLQAQATVKLELMQLIKQQRLNALSQGGYFSKYTTRGAKIKNRRWLVKYIPSQQTFEFSDEMEKYNDFRIDLAKVKNIVVGQNCPHVKLRGQSFKPEHAFSLILTEEPTYINLAAVSKRQLDVVMDGFKALLGQEMNSASCEDDLQVLTEMHIRLQLLDAYAYGIELPQGDSPSIPPPPVNYDFHVV